MASQLGKLLTGARAKGKLYWTTAVLITFSGVYLTHLLHEKHVWSDAHYLIYRVFQKANWQRTNPSRTVIVEITDDDYWKGELARRIPLKRSYLAKLIKALDSANPQVIAIDFQLRSPTVDGNPREHPDYQCETQDFLSTVKDVASRRSVILPASIGPGYILESSIYTGYDFGPNSSILTGYIELPYDLRNLPLALALKNRPGKLDSFSGATVRAIGDKAIAHLERGEGERLPFGSYFDRTSFDHVLAADVLKGNRVAKDIVKYKIALVGATWHQFAYNRGPLADAFHSPMGEIPGVYVHANFIESVLKDRVYYPLPRAAEVAIEVTLVLALAVVFALPIGGWNKCFSVCGSCVLLLVVAYLSFQNLGLFFDFFIPVLMVATHAVFDEVREWRKKAIEFDNEHAKGGFDAQIQQYASAADFDRGLASLPNIGKPDRPEQARRSE